MTENLLETIRATVQDFLAPEIRTHGVRLEALDHKIDETKETLVAKIEAVDRALQDTKETLSTRIEAVANSVEETKQTLRADIRTVEVRIQSLENLIRQAMDRISLKGSLRERIASLEARVSQH